MATKSSGRTHPPTPVAAPFDLTALDTFIKFKSRTGATAGFNPDPAHILQLDDYLEASKSVGPDSISKPDPISNNVRTGILTDGKYWLLRWPEAGSVRTMPAYARVLESADQWLPLYEWLHDRALLSLE